MRGRIRFFRDTPAQRSVLHRAAQHPIIPRAVTRVAHSRWRKRDRARGPQTEPPPDGAPSGGGGGTRTCSSLESQPVDGVRLTESTGLVCVAYHRLTCLLESPPSPREWTPVLETFWRRRGSWQLRARAALRLSPLYANQLGKLRTRRGTKPPTGDLQGGYEHRELPECGWPPAR